MRLEILVDSPPFSINSAYYKASFTRTRECRSWAASIMKQLCTDSYKIAFAKFREAYVDEPLKVSLEFYHTIYRAKKNEISRQSMDLSNIEKLFIDILFDKRFDCEMIDNPKFTYRSLMIDDKNIMQLESRKIQRLGDVSQIKATIETIDDIYISGEPTLADQIYIP